MRLPLPPYYLLTVRGGEVINSCVVACCLGVCGDLERFGRERERGRMWRECLVESRVILLTTSYSDTYLLVFSLQHHHTTLPYLTYLT